MSLRVFCVSFQQRDRSLHAGVVFPVWRSLEEQARLLLAILHRKPRKAAERRSWYLTCSLVKEQDWVKVNKIEKENIK